MSTIKSSDEHLTLNADGSSKDIKFQANGVEKASISSAGAFTSTTIDATKLTGTIPNFTSTGIDDNATSTAITIDSNEIVTMPSQPAFIVNSTVSQAISNATPTTINFTTEIADRNADYDGTNTFTAPVTGLYSFSAQVITDAGTTPDTRFSEAYLYIITSNREAVFYWGDLESNADDQLAMQGTALMDMDAGDTAFVRVYYSRYGAYGGTNTVVHATNLVTFFTGHLVC